MQLKLFQVHSNYCTGNFLKQKALLRRTNFGQYFCKNWYWFFLCWKPSAEFITPVRKFWSFARDCQFQTKFWEFQTKFCKFLTKFWEFQTKFCKFQTKFCKFLTKFWKFQTKFCKFQTKFCKFQTKFCKTSKLRFASKTGFNLMVQLANPQNLQG